MESCVDKSFLSSEHQRSNRQVSKGSGVDLHGGVGQNTSWDVSKVALAKVNVLQVHLVDAKMEPKYLKFIVYWFNENLNLSILVWRSIQLLPTLHLHGL